MKKIVLLGRKYKAQLAAILAIFTVAGISEYLLGRSLFGPDGVPGLFTFDVYTEHQSQEFFDVYSLSHIIHGILFYAFLTWAFPKMPLAWRLVGAVAIEAVWEVLENSPLIIDRYRAVTIAWGYVGDSIWNSLADIVMVIIGFFFAHRFSFWIIVASVIAMELFALYLVRDGLTLNVIMLTFPIDAIREWQLEAMPK